MKYEKEKKQVGLDVQSLKEEDLKGVNGGGAITNFEQFGDYRCPCGAHFQKYDQWLKHKEKCTK